MSAPPAPVPPPAPAPAHTHAGAAAPVGGGPVGGPVGAPVAAAPGAPVQQQQQQRQPGGGALNDRDVAEWKERFNAVLSDPGAAVKSKSAAGAQPWGVSFFGCCSPIDTCLFSWCIPCVVFGKTHHRIRRDGSLAGYEPINTSCLLFLASTCVALHWVPLSMQRADLRAKYNLQGSCLGDIARACCCGCCDLVQQDKEAAAREPLVGASAVGDKTQYQPQGGMTYPTQ